MVALSTLFLLVVSGVAITAWTWRPAWLSNQPRLPPTLLDGDQSLAFAHTEMDYSRHPAHPDRPTDQARLLHRCGGRGCGDASAVGVTVAIPFHNAGNHLTDTLECVRRQTMAAEQIVVLDDNSALEHRQSGEAACKAVPGCLFITSPASLGVCTVRNKLAMQLTTSKYVLFVDADDLIEPTYIEKGVWFLESRPDVMVVKGDSVGFGTGEYYWKHGFSNPAAFVHENVQTLTSLMRRDEFVALGGFSADFAKTGLEDYEFWVRMMASGRTGYQIPELMDWYRRHKGSNKWWSTPENLAKTRQRIVDLHPSFMEQRHTPAPVQVKLPQQLPVPLNLTQFATIQSKLVADAPCRVLMLLPGFAAGGPDSASVHLLHALASRQRCQLAVIGTAPGHAETMRTFESITADVTYLPHILPEVYYIHYVLALMASREVQVVVASNSAQGIAMLPLIRQTHPHVRIVALEYFAISSYEDVADQLLSLPMEAYIDHHVTVGTRLSTQLDSHGIPADRMTTCYYGAPKSLLEYSRAAGLASLQARAPRSAAQFVILMAGQLTDQKRPLLAVDIAAKLQQQAPWLDFCVVVVGDGPLRAELLQTASATGLHDRFHFLGHMTQADTAAIIAASDVMMQPSETESMSLSVLEALALGTAVVATRASEHEALAPPRRPGEAPALQLVTALTSNMAVTGIVRGVLDVAKFPPSSQAMRKWMRQYFTADQFTACAINAILDSSRAVKPAPESRQASLDRYQAHLRATFQQSQQARACSAPRCGQTCGAVMA